MKNILLTIFISSLVFQSDKSNLYEPVVVFELFTSQGCSSCPPADELLKEVKLRYMDKDVIVLSYHVDYWNYIGWKDPFSKASFSNKQRQYSAKFHNSTIYTPQIVVNGKEHFVGSDKSIMDFKLRENLSKKVENKIKLFNVKKTDSDVNFNYEVAGQINNKRLRAVLVVDERITDIKRGENRNRILKNSNIVVEELYLDLKSAEGKGRLSIPSIISEKDNLRLIVLVESLDLDITGGTQVKL